MELSSFGVSVDMRKAFDRVEHCALFNSLTRQGLDKPYINVLRRLYAGQHGVLGQEVRFPIERGVRQGDVLSPMLFNSVLEEAVTDWNRKLIEHGLALAWRGTPNEYSLCG